MISQSELQKSIAALVSVHDSLAKAMVPAGITRLLLLALDPSDDVCRGTSYSRAIELPPEISVHDDLILIKNLLKHRELGELVDAVLNLPRFSGDHVAFGAPDLASALQQVIEQVSDRNPPFSTSLTSGDAVTRISLQSDARLGVFGGILELLTATVLLRLIISFLHFRESKTESLDSLIFASRLLDGKLISSFGRFGWLSVKQSVHETSITIPASLLYSPNPSAPFDLTAVSIKEGATVRAATHFTLDMDTLEEFIDVSLRSKGRVVQLHEIAQRFGISERTILRKLAQSGRTLRQIVTDIRMKWATELLGDPLLRISDISSATGYSAASSFVRAFRQAHGMSPHQWRKRAGPQSFHC